MSTGEEFQTVTTAFKNAFRTRAVLDYVLLKMTEVVLLELVGVVPSNTPAMM